MKAEELGPTLYVRASYKEPWINLVPQEEYGMGVGVLKSTFIVQRSEPTSDEEDWPMLATSGSSTTAIGYCGGTWNKVSTGFLERKFQPVGFKLSSEVFCVDDMPLYWKSASFMEQYFQALEKRNVKSLVNRLANTYMNFVPAGFAVDGAITWTDPLHFYSQVGATGIVPPANVDITDLGAPTASNVGELTQTGLDATAVELMEEGATDPNSNGWITLGPSGPLFTLMVGPDASNRLKLNNSELVLDLRSGYDTFAEAIKRDFG